MMKRLMTGVVAFALAAGQAQAVEKVIFQLGWLPGGDKAPAYIALHKGLFQKAGLDVEIRSGRGSADTMTKVATGAADLGEVGLGTIMLAKAQGDMPVVAVMPIFTKQPDVLLVDKAGPIKTLKDVEGRKIATSPFSSSNVYWPIVLSANGLDAGKVTLIKADPAALTGLLATGQVAGVINWVTASASTSDAFKSQGKAMGSLSWSDYGFDGYGQSIVASEKLLKEHPDTVKAFLEAYREGEKIMREDPDEAVAAIQAKAPELDAALIKGDGAAAISLIFNDTSAKDGLGVYEPSLVATTWKWVAKSQGLPESQLDPQKSVASILSK
jgi:NitT/TauT family transport system substrate-binding protein